MARYTVELSDTDTPEQIARLLTEAMAYVHTRLAPVMVWYKGAPYVAIVPPDAGLAWERAEESQRLSRIATASAGLPPLPDPPGTEHESGAGFTITKPFQGGTGFRRVRFFPPPGTDQPGTPVRVPERE